MSEYYKNYQQPFYRIKTGISNILRFSMETPFFWGGVIGLCIGC